MNWFKRFRSTKGMQNKTGLAANMLELLSVDFARLDALKPGLGQRALAYVVDGEEKSVLQDLSKQPNCREAFGLIWGHGHPSDEAGRCRVEFFKRVDMEDHMFFLRLAQVYDACCTHVQLPFSHPEIPSWLEVFLIEATQFTVSTYPSSVINSGVRADVVERMLDEVGLEPDLLVKVTFGASEKHSVEECFARMHCALRGANERIVFYPQSAMEALRSSSFRKTYALELLNSINAHIDSFADAVVDLAVSSSATMRDLARPLLHSNTEVALPYVELKLTEGKTDERRQAAQLFTTLAGDGCRARLEQRLSEEKSDKVIAAMRNALDSLSASDNSGALPEFDIPPLAPVDPIAPLPACTASEVFALLERFNQRIQSMGGAICREDRETVDKNLQPGGIRAVLQALQGDSSGRGSFERCVNERFLPYNPGILRIVREMLTEFASLSGIRLIHITRMLVMTYQVTRSVEGSDIYLYENFEPCIKRFEKTSGSRVGLRELAAVFEAMGLDGDCVGWGMLCQWSRHISISDHTWRYFAERKHIFEELFGFCGPKVQLYGLNSLDSWWRSKMRERAFDILVTFPSLPNLLIPMLWDLALRPSGSEAPKARACIEKLPGKERRIIDALGESKQDIRATAADWLAAIDCREAVPALRAALVKERQEIPRVAMINALEALGESIDDYISPSAVAKEAAKGLQKGIPSAASWFPFDKFPPVRWKADSQPVPKEVLTWWVVQQNKLGNPEPSQLLQRYCDLLVEADRHILGLFVLNAWIERDTVPIYTYDEAAKLAETEWPNLQYRFDDATPERLYKICLQELLNRTAYSAVSEKGILALAGACGGSEIAPIVARYIRRWGGGRSTQCQLLLKVLSFAGSPNATQLLLKTAGSHRVPGIQKEAQASVAKLAERHGWTVDELADRTAPTAGFDSQGRMELDYGPRAFTAVLGPDLQITLLNADNESVSSLPDARKNDDPEMVGEAKAQLSSARRELKSTISAQRGRLYEAMCTQRTWRFDDWETYLSSHPILTHLCRRLVWVTCDKGGFPITFRPLGDGTLTGPADNQITLESDTHICLAHSCNTDQAAGESWIRHFIDYEIEPIFDQFTKPMYILSDDLMLDTEFVEFEGYMIESFTLRNRATQLGYHKGALVEWGWLDTYVKKFMGLGIEAVLEFSGSRLPEENLPVALKNMRFRRPEVKPLYMQNREDLVPLGDVPPVLLSECWNDLRILAAHGAGYDQDWQSKVDS